MATGLIVSPSPAEPATPPLTGRYRGRFAPSPSGSLHLGSLYTALASFLQARSAGGQWYLRIDDLDPLRTRPETIDRIQYTLDALGLQWDGAVLLQSQRFAAYQEALATLTERGWVYRCACSRKDLATTPVYPGTCRHAAVSPHHPHALRLIVGSDVIHVDDGLQGNHATRLDQTTGDFIIYRRDGVYAYHLATVLDDALLGITEVLRGVDLLAVTPEQVYLRHLLGLPQLPHVHIPVLVNPAGQKLSKQTYAPAVPTAEPSRLLIHLLNLLDQQPPTGLDEARPEVILAWAIAHWNPARLAGVRAITITPV